MPIPDGRPLFTFGVISDSHVNEAEDRSASPFASNRSANGRFRNAVRELDRRKPDFTVHLGDMANPLPQLATYEAAAESFRSIASELSSPLHLIPGNHCVGDKPTGWVPVPRVSRAALDQYERVYGSQWSSFEHGPCHFATINSLLINSGLAAERDQRRWLESDLGRASRQGRRIWLLMHYPAFVAAPDEPGSYDNLDEPGRTWLLELLMSHAVEAVCAGHVHHFLYNQYGSTDLYNLPATSFVRQDYSEMFTVGPRDEEGGRDDVAKLGFGLVTVFERGHALEVVRTGGRGVGPGSQPAAAKRPVAAPAARARWPSVGIEMRENWLERLPLRPNNSVSPFVRRWTRNDWPLLALGEMGVRRIRISLQELDKPDVVDRMAALHDAGYRFIVYSHGIPGERQYRLVRERRSLLSGWELILGLGQIDSVARGIARFPAPSEKRGALPIFLNEVRDPVDLTVDDANVKHEANYGFLPEESARIEKLSRSRRIAETFSGLVFRLRRRGEGAVHPADAIREIARLGAAAGMRHQAHVLFSGSLTADRLVDDLDAANRIAESAVAAAAAAHLDVYLDTFEDVDRGYFVRHGLVDRRYNPRLGGRVLGQLAAVLADASPLQPCDGPTLDLPGGRLWRGYGAGGFCALLLPVPGARLDEIETPEPVACGALRLVDLASGETVTVPASSKDRTIRPARTLEPESPLWIAAEPAGGAAGPGLG